MVLLKQGGGFLVALLAPLAASLVQPVISSVVKGITGRRARKADKDMDKHFFFYHLNKLKLLSISIKNLGLMVLFREPIYLE